MKTIICFLFPVLLFAQTNYPDTLLLTDGRTFSCLVTGINNNKVEFLYLIDKSESLVLEAVDQLLIEDLGIVYNSNQSFIKSIDQINEFVNSRMKKLEEEKLVQQELAKMTVVSDAEQIETDYSNQSNSDFTYQKSFRMKKWSFGVLLIPYYSGNRYRVIYNTSQYPPQVMTQSYAENEINMESQLAFGITPNFRLMFDAAYSSTFNELRYEYHVRSEFNEFDSGNLTSSSLDIFDFNIGAKYYFINSSPENIGIYVTAGFGKQFAFAEEKSEDLFPGPGPIPIIEDNYEDYVEGLNSPWHANVGFGAEYLFNESLALNTNIRFIYSTSSSNFDYRYISEFETYTHSSEYSSSEFNTRIGLGLNFYF